jgi:predicted TIM-barrel fold metal-dependent hydrolase
MGDALFAQLVDAHGEDRILFGSDLPWGDPAADRRRIESMALCERTKEKIFEENARKLLGI